MMKLKGIGVSSGVAIGRVIHLKTEVTVANHEFQGAIKELETIQTAILKAKKETEKLIAKLVAENRHQEAEIFGAQILMLEDPELLERSKQLIEHDKKNAHHAFHTAVGEFVSTLEAIEDEYLRHRALDLKDIRTRVLSQLSGTSESSPNVSAEKSDSPAILVCEDLTPSMAASLDLSQFQGFVAQCGSKTSHTAILARAREIPAVLGVAEIIAAAKANQWIALDGDSGEVYLDPSTEQQKELELRRENFLKLKKHLLEQREHPAVTKDGFKVVIAANIAQAQDIPSVRENAAEAVGLYRTEFLFLDRQTAPTEEEQFKIYHEILKGLPNKEVFIRTIDVGGDKHIPYLKSQKEENPFLGNRAVRLCLRDKHFFKTQLRAILRASSGHQVGVMVPMISNIEEIKDCRALIAECQDELARENKNHSSEIDFGVMIEVPSAALIIDHVCKYVDFVSIGTNDLTQYVCAVDRMNSEIQDLYDSAHPGLLRLMNQIITTARQKDVFVGICGSISHDPKLMPLWLGMGVHELSMTAQHIPATKARVRNLSQKECQNLVTKALACETSAEVRALLN